VIRILAKIGRFALELRIWDRIELAGIEIKQISILQTSLAVHDVICAFHPSRAISWRAATDENLVH
jgi:hypothetical protein